MFKYFSAVKKEWLLLLRDRAGMIVLFAMPMFLVVLMSLLQENGWNSLVHESKVPIVFVNTDNDSLGLKIRNGLRDSNFFTIYDSIESKPATEESVREAVKRGQFVIGIVIPAGVTQTIRSNVRLMVAKTLAGFGLFNAGLLKDIPLKQADSITFYFDPAIRSSFKNAVISSIREYHYKVETEMIFKSFNQEIANQFPTFKPPVLEYKDALAFKEVYPRYQEISEAPNTVQHNVPAWTIFAMFFIVIPLTSSMIKEREEGSLFRLLVMPVSYMNLLLAKAGVYFIVCMIQSALMILSGIFILPLFHIPMLDIGGQLFSLTIVSIVTALAALGYGMLVGTVASTHQQAAAFGSVSIIILAAMGGLWVPIYLMPEFMRHVATLSPLNWAINGYYSIFLRGGSIVNIFPEIFKLLLFFLVTVIITAIYRQFKSPLKK